MNNSTSVSRVATPWHVWLVGVLALLWNSIGAFDYLMTQTRNASYMSQFTPEQLAYFYAFPAWVVSTWALSVWGAVLGSVLLLLRHRWAVMVFGLSLATMVITTIYNFGLTNGADIMGTFGVIFSVVIFAIAVALFLYARHLARAGVLR